MTTLTPPGRSVEDLGEEITALAGHLNAATCRWLELIGEFDALEGWAEWGCRSCAHWIAWRCSMAPGPAREHVRVARRLRALPQIRDAFARGELSFSKVRAVTRVEDIEREAELLELARCSTAAQLERIVRGYRQVLRADAVRVHEHRFLSVEHDDDGSVVVRGRLSSEDGAILLRALDIAREQLGATAGASLDAAEASALAEGAGGAASPPDRATQNADALVVLADSVLASPHIAGERTGGDRVQVVVHVDSGTLGEPGASAHGEAPGKSTAEDARSCERRCDLADGTPLAAETVRRMSCDAAIVPLLDRGGETLSVGRKTRSIPPSLRRALQNRDDGCRFPGCGQRRFVDAHHIEHWAHGGETKLTNLVQLCRHHHRLLHEGGFTVERSRGDGATAGDLVFRRPDGRRLRAVPPAPPGDVRRLRDQHARRGLRITPTTPVPRWYGERLDLPAAVDAVLAASLPRGARA